MHIHSNYIRGSENPCGVVRSIKGCTTGWTKRVPIRAILVKVSTLQPLLTALAAFGFMIIEHMAVAVQSPVFTSMLCFRPT
jgi:hypothetical protein